MNIFVLTPGRSGSTTFARACSHITNYTAAHESRVGFVGKTRLAYPPAHIEVDNRLVWFLGRLDQAYGDDAFYVHLTRDRLATAKSLLQRYGSGIIGAYAFAILWKKPYRQDPLEVCLDYLDTVNSNIDLFLQDKTHKMDFSLENAAADFEMFWKTIKAEGDKEAALAEWQRAYNASDSEGLMRRLQRATAVLRWNLSFDALETDAPLGRLRRAFSALRGRSRHNPE